MLIDLKTASRSLSRSWRKGIGMKLSSLELQKTFSLHASRRKVPERSPRPELLEGLAKVLSTLEPSLQKEFLSQFHSLKQERNEDFLLQSLFQIGVRLKFAGCENAALNFFTRLSQNDIPKEIRERAHQEAVAITGSEGSWAMRAEYLLSGLAQGETTFKGILPMLGTTLVGQLVGTAVLGGLGRAAWTGWAGFLTKGVGRRLGAGLVSLAVETPVLLGLNQVVSPGHGSFGESFLPTVLSLGVFRAVGGVRQFIAARRPLAAGINELMRSPLPTFLGLYAVNKVEAKRMGIENGTTGTDTVFNLFHLLVGDRLGRNQFGLNRFQAELAARASHTGNTGVRQFIAAATDVASARPQAIAISVPGGLASGGNSSAPAGRELRRSPSAIPAKSIEVWAASGDRPSEPRIGLSLGLNLGSSLQQTPELTESERRQSELAMDYWEEKPHFEMKFPLSVMLRALGTSEASAGRPALAAAGQSDEFSAEFIKVSEKEFSALDPEEKCGISLGDCIIVSEGVPEAYVPMVVANLAFLMRIRDDNVLKKLIDDDKISVDVTRHWTANILDLILAKEHFTADPHEYAAFLRWRKQVERTDFFKNPEIDGILKQKLLHQHFKRTTHPLARSLQSKKSWAIGGVLHMLGGKASEEAKLLGVTKADMIIRICGGHEDFDPESMLLLIQSLPKLVQTRRILGRSQNYVDLRHSVELLEQAHLLTQEVVGRNSAIMQETETSGMFALSVGYMRSLRALSDRIIFFTREGLLHSGLTRKTLLFLRGALPLLNEEPSPPVAVQLDSSQEESHLKIKARALGKQIHAVQSSLDRYIRLRIKYVDMGVIDDVPGPIDEQYRLLLKLKERLEAELSELSKALSSLGEPAKNK
jgi:hypothetical protein